MGLVNLLLFIFGLLLVVSGVLRLFHQSWIDGAVLTIIGLVLLGSGGYIST